MAASPEARLVAVLAAAKSPSAGALHANDWIGDAHRLSHAQSVLFAFLDGSSSVSAQQLITTVHELPPHVQECLIEQVWIPISHRYEKELLDALALAARSGGGADAGPSAARAEDVLRRASSVYARYEQVNHVLQQHRQAESLRLISQRALLVYKDDFACAVHRDLRMGQRQSLVRDALLALDLANVWRELVSHASRRLVKSKVLHRASVDDDGQHSDTPSSRDHNDILAEERQHDFEASALTGLNEWILEHIASLLNAWQGESFEPLLQQLMYTLHKTLGRLRARQLFDIISDFPQSAPALQDLMACCEEEAGLKQYVSAQLGAALQRRLLHPGASTRDIIQYYTHLIRALRYVDPSGVILSHVIGPVRSYLRARADTIPVIVASLLGQAGDFTLLRDMMREAADVPGLGGRKNGGNVAVGADTSITVYDDTTSGGNDGLTVDIAAMDESKRMVFIPDADEDWAPRPIDAGPDYRQSRKSDVIAIIVSIFDDEEGFIAALERSCAEQIVQVSRYDMHKEYETNENLKKRFGDASMSRCDVMLNDVKRSQRTDRSIHRALELRQDQVHEEDEGEGLSADDKDAAHAALSVLHPLVLSRQFWPLFKDDDPSPGTRPTAPGGGAAANRADGPSMMFASAPHGDSASAADAAKTPSAEEPQPLPRAYAHALSAYQRHFAAVVHGRKLRWLPGRDRVRVRVEMDDGRTIDERVTPLQASVLQLAAGATPSASEPAALLVTDVVAEQLSVPGEAVHKAMLFWMARGLLAEVSRGLFTVVEDVTR